MSATTIDNDDKVTPADLRAKIGELQGEVAAGTEAARSTVATIGTVVAVIVVLSVFSIGLRRGRKRTTVVEIRRV